MTTDLHEELQAALGRAYAIERELGGGGMARVFVAEETALGRKVVVKALPPEMSGAMSAERFKREVQLAARLQHPHIVPLLSAGEAGDLLYYTMPFIQGESLRWRLTREGGLPVTDVMRLLSDVCDALCYAHQQGVVHRDLKPENVLVSGRNSLVTDFGIAKALSAAAGAPSAPTTVGVALGTPAYMAPEQAAGDPIVDHRADLYSVGVLAYELLTGRPPFGGLSRRETLIAHTAVAPEPVTTHRPAVSPALASLVMRCLEKHPADRPQSAEEVLRELEAAAPTPSGGTPVHPGRVDVGPDDMTASGLRVGHRARRVAVLAGVVAAVVLLGYGMFALAGKGHNDDATAQPVAGGTLGTPGGPGAVAKSGAPAAPVGKSVAVLPFVNLSAEREDDYFSDGMTEELITALSKVEGLRVPARTSTFAFKGKNADVREIGRQLGVGAVLEGSVRRSRDRLRVTAQLVSATDGYHVWSETYDRELRDVFQVQDELARAIVKALQVRLKSMNQTDTALVKAATANLEAHDLYLQGRSHWNQRTYESLLKAAQYFQRAIKQDSNYAQAYAGLADTYVLLSAFGPVRPRDAFPRVKRAALRALALDSTLAEAHTSLAYVRMLGDYDWKRAGAGFRRAIALNPSYATAHHWYAEYLSVLDQDEEALAEMERAHTLDPLSRIISPQLGFFLAVVGRYDDALRRFDAALELDPNFARTHVMLCWVYLLKRLPREATGACERAAALSERTQGMGLLTYAYAASGDRTKAMEVLRELEARSQRDYVQPYSIAVAYLGLGAADRTFRWLERALVERDPFLTLNISA